MTIDESYTFDLPLHHELVEVTKEQFIEIGRWRTDEGGTYFDFQYQYKLVYPNAYHFLNFQNPWQVKEVLHWLKTGKLREEP